MGKCEPSDSILLFQLCFGELTHFKGRNSPVIGETHPIIPGSNLERESGDLGCSSGFATNSVGALCKPQFT